MNTDFLKHELECDAHNISQAYLLGQGKRVVSYINKTMKDMAKQKKKLGIKD